MLRKKYRLPKKDGAIVFKEGRVTKDVLFLIKSKKNNFSYSRFAFVVPLKIEKKSTKRNKIRRKVYEILRHQYKFIKKGFDVLIILQDPGISKKKYSEIEKELKNTLKKAKLLIFDTDT